MWQSTLFFLFPGVCVCPDELVVSDALVEKKKAQREKKCEEQKKKEKEKTSAPLECVYKATWPAVTMLVLIPLKRFGGKTCAYVLRDPLRKKYADLRLGKTTTRDRNN